MTTGQVSFSEALRRAEAAIRASAPGFNTLTAGQKMIAVLRRAVRDAGGEPAGPSFPSPADEPRVIDALETQLRNLQRAAEVAAPYNRLLIEATAPEPGIGDDPRLLATEGGAPRHDPAPQRPAPRQPGRPAPWPESRPFTPAIHDEEEQVMGQAAFVDPAPDLAMRERAVALQQELRDLGFTPVIEGRIPLSEAAVAVIRLTNQLNAVLDPEREARIAPREFSSTSDAAAAPTSLSGLAQPSVDQQAAAPDVPEFRLAQISAWQEKIRAAGGRPEFTGTVTPENIFRVIATLESQLERLLAVERARQEIEEGATPTDILDPRELEIMALRQAIRDYGEVPVVTGDVRPDSYTTAILTLNRQLKDITSRPRGFDSAGFNTDPFSTDAQAIGGFNEDRSIIHSMTQPGPAEQAWALEAEEEAREREELETAWQDALIDEEGIKRTPSIELLDTFNRLKPYFRPGELEPLLARIFLIRDGDAEAFYGGNDKWDPAAQVSAFLDQVTGVFNLNFHRAGTGVDFAEENLERLQSIELQQRRNADGLTFREAGANFYTFLDTQWIPDSVADSLPTPFRHLMQSMLDYTSPIGALSLAAELILTGGSATALSVLGDMAADTTSLMLEERGDSLAAREIKANLVGEGVKLSPDILRSLGDLSDEEEVMKAIFGIASASVDEADKKAIRSYAERLFDRARTSGVSLATSFGFDLFFGGIESYVHSQAAKGPIVQDRVDVEDRYLNSDGLFVAESPYSYMDDPHKNAYLKTMGSLDFNNALMDWDAVVTFEILGTIAATVAGRDDLPEAQRMLASQALGKRMRGEELTGLESDTLQLALGESFEDALDRAQHTAYERKQERAATYLSPQPKPEPAPEAEEGNSFLDYLSPYRQFVPPNPYGWYGSGR